MSDNYGESATTPPILGDRPEHRTHYRQNRSAALALVDAASPDSGKVNVRLIAEVFDFAYIAAYQLRQSEVDDLWVKIRKLGFDCARLKPPAEAAVHLRARLEGVEKQLEAVLGELLSHKMPPWEHGCTGHGHPCCDAAHVARPDIVVRCGGCRLCRVCRIERDRIHLGKDPYVMGEFYGEEE